MRKINKHLKPFLNHTTIITLVLTVNGLVWLSLFNDSVYNAVLTPLIGLDAPVIASEEPIASLPPTLQQLQYRQHQTPVFSADENNGTIQITRAADETSVSAASSYRPQSTRTAVPARRVAPRPRGQGCAEKNDHPRNSPNKGKHRDEDCCPDPDEWPMPGCAYSAAGYKIMLKTPSK